MPNDIANNMADTIHFLEEDNASMMKSLTDLQLAYNEQMIELKEAKRLLKQAVDDISVLLELNDSCYYCKHYVAGECLCVDDCNRSCEWHCTDDALKLLGGNENV